MDQILPPTKQDDLTRFWSLAFLTLLASIVRLLWISNPSQVVFDEVHFGGFASKYINHQFFMDVHPPLGKLLFAWTALFAGFDGAFSFSVRKKN